MEKIHRTSFEDHYKFKAILVFLDKEIAEKTRDSLTQLIEQKINNPHTQELFLEKLTKELKDKLVPRAVGWHDAGQRHALYRPGGQ